MWCSGVLGSAITLFSPPVELTEIFKEYEKVCIQDRKRKHKMKEAAEK